MGYPCPYVSPPPPSRSGQTYNNPTFTGTVTITGTSTGFADGSAASPSIPFASDADGSGTGFYRSAADTIGVAANGVLSFSISGSQVILGPTGAGRSYYNTGSGLNLGSANGVLWNANTDAAAGSADASVWRAGTNSLRFNGTTSSATTTSLTQFQKATASIANAVATTVATVTIPNAAHSATYEVMVVGSLGAGGAIGANEASATNVYTVTVARTAGVAAVVGISSAYGASTAAVAGASTVTATLSNAAVSGAVGATNTIDLQVTISRGTGSSTNHTAVITVRLLNANATGVTIA